LTAKGTSGQWRGIRIDDGGAARFSNCSFKGAQWAIHSHFTPLTVEKSRFLHNDGGVKFRGNQVKLESNYFMNNGTAVRYWESDPDIRLNTFDGNDTAIFCREGSSKGTIRDNNFLMSASYHIKLGELQSEDVDGIDNYWGTVSCEKIEEKIYDRMDTPYLGRVGFIPFRKAPISASTTTGGESPTPMIDQDISRRGR
jgi:nitrous oxidase accessory protein NosD